MSVAEAGCDASGPTRRSAGRIPGRRLAALATVAVLAGGVAGGATPPAAASRGAAVLADGASGAPSVPARAAAASDRPDTSGVRLPPLLPEEEEIALARSAAPPELANRADVWVLRRGGHIKVRTGSSGAACMVSRDHPASLYPICYDAEAARSVLPRALLSSRLREAGLRGESLDRELALALQRGEIRPPGRGAIAYMLSPRQEIYAGEEGPRVGRWHPHLMIYIPGLTATQVGFEGLADGDLHVGDEGTPFAHLVVLARDWAAQGAPAGPPLSVEPGWVCPGDTVRVRRPAGAGPAQLTWTQGTAPAQRHRVEPGGTLALKVAAGADPVVVLEASGGAAEDTVSIHPPELIHQLRRSPTCSGRLATASMGISPGRGSDAIRARTVTNVGDYPVQVIHRGLTARLDAGESTAAFADLPFTGDWGVLLDAAPENPWCPLPGSPATPAAPEIRLDIVTSCADGVG